MEKSYAAFGLSLRSSFALPGMAPVESDGLPALSLDLEAGAALEDAWSGALAPTPWRGRLGDGEELTIEWGRAGDLRFGYGRRAAFRLDPSGTRLGCAPADVIRLDWQRVLLTRILPNVAIARGDEALHACAVLTPLGVVAIAGPSGMGKSTLAGELVRRGSQLFSDDVVVLRRGLGAAVEAQPATPHMNVSAGASPADDLGATLGILAGERWVAARSVADRAAGVAAVVALERGPGLPLEVEPLPKSPLTLAPYMLGLPDDEGRDAERFALYSDLAESAALLRLGADRSIAPGQLAEALEEALGVSPALAARDVA
jgi:hypothetical protein